MNFRCFTLRAPYHSALSGLRKKLISFSVSLLVFFHCATIVIELKIIWGTRLILKSLQEYKSSPLGEHLPMDCLYTCCFERWKVSIIAQSDTASPKQWGRHVLKCVSLGELSVHVKLSSLAGLAVFISLTVFDHQPRNSNSVSFIVLSQLRDSEWCGHGEESRWVPVTHLMLSYVGIGQGYCRQWERSVCWPHKYQFFLLKKKKPKLLCFTHSLVSIRKF